MDNQMIEDYKRGMSLNACSKKYALSVKEVRKELRNRQVHIRNRAEQNVFTNQSRGYSVNHLYFSELDQTKAYYLGFLAADGTVYSDTNEIKVCLSAIDKEWLEEFKLNINSKAPVSESVTNKGYSVARLSFSSAMIKKDLAHYSIVPRKTYHGVSMKNIPDDLKVAYLKGYFDGDGSFSWSRKTGSGIVKICSYKRNILDEFTNLFTRQFDGKYNSNVYKLCRDNRELYSWEISTLPSIELLRLFYSLDTPCLLRKKQKFEDFLSFRIEKKSTSQDGLCTKG